MNKRALFPVVVTLLVAAAASVEARVISYAPVSSAITTPAVQKRTNVFFYTVEQIHDGTAQRWELVRYHAAGAMEPAVVFAASQNAVIGTVAIQESSSGVARILMATNSSLNGDNPSRTNRYLFSADGGATWKVLPIQAPYSYGYYAPSPLPDVGGPVARGAGSQVRIGSDAWPFVVSVVSGNTSEIVAIGASGHPRHLAWISAYGPGGIATPIGNPNNALAGSNREGTRFLVIGSPLLPEVQKPFGLRILDLEGTLTDVVDLPSGDPGMEGWITPDGGVYVESRGFSGPRALLYYENGSRTIVAEPFPGVVGNQLTLFAVPTHDFRGAWIVKRGPGYPTALLRHEAGSVAIEQWRDEEGPQVEAIHAADSGERLLIQVHRPRPQVDQRIFQDPALAIWEIGAPAPSHYDELFLNEAAGKGFVSLDVDRVAAGGSFVFDSANVVAGGVPVVPISGGPSGGGDVAQEWGVVRASLQQRLVVSAAARLPGGYGSTWRTDLTLRSGVDEAIAVEVKYVPHDPTQAIRMVMVPLAAGEIRLVRDVLATLFGVESGGGPLFLTPPLGTAITATSRTYTDSDEGTYGMSIPAVDVFASASPRFPVTFAGAFQGANYRTNVIATDVAGRGAVVRMNGETRFSTGPVDAAFMEVPVGGGAQITALGAQLAAMQWEPGALRFTPTEGEAVAAVVTIDNRTNDPTWFPPDVSSPVVRVIPLVGHADGAFGSKFRTDVYLFNPSKTTRNVTLSVKNWDGRPEVTKNFTLLGGEARVLEDVLFTWFGMTGIARLRYISGWGADSQGVRVTSRTYTVEEDGGTYGLLIPPLNAFQSAGVDEALEILGAIADPGFRTNIALVDLTAFPDGRPPHQVDVEIYDAFGTKLDAFVAEVPVASGVQLLDLFGSRELPLDGQPVTIRIAPHSGLIGAFGSMVDNGTNDPTYLPAGLLAKQ
ncbi:MAG: hypothetical protein ACRD2J_17650 [Thermoanaerobaculia bacterium]